MKKITLFLLTCLIVACSSDNSTPNIETGLAGVWLLVSSIDEDGEEYIPVDEGACPHETIISETSIIGKTYYGTNCELSVESDPLSYTLNGDTMNFELGSEKESLKILELTATTLKIKEGDDSFYQIGTYSRQ